MESLVKTLYPRDQVELIGAELVLTASSEGDGHIRGLPQLDSIEQVDQFGPTTLATAIVLALPALLVGIAFAAQDKCRADVCFWQHHAQAN